MSGFFDSERRVLFMISVIVPVYNTEKYLDKCIKSILVQAYRDLEIILINDGSTDHSLQILEKYQADDDRIRVISVENGGQGRARNIGIEQATGEYIMFVDSDDWISEDCVETLHSALKDGKYDISIGNIAKTKFEEEELEFVYNSKIPDVINDENKKQFLFKILAFPFAKLIKKELFTVHKILFPTHYFEDTVTLPLVYAVADKIYSQNKVVYYYRNRAGSSVNSIDYIYDRIKCIPTLEDGLKRLGLYEAYRDEFRRFVLQRSRINRRKVRALMDREYQEFERRQFIFDYEELGEIDDKAGLNVCVYGSYNLMIAAKIFLRLKKEASVPNYFGFQNIISSMSPSNRRLDALIGRLPEGNSFRKTALVQDFEKTLLCQEPEQPGIDYFILDFLEERYDTGCVEDTCFTLSDAFQDVKASLDMKYETLQCFSTEWSRIWHDKCDEFIQLIRGTVGDGKIILVKMKLSEKHMQNGKESCFGDVLPIRHINEQLESCYDYFIQNCPEALVVEVEHLESYYTDREFRHGCYPWHLNDKAYQDIAREIKKTVDYHKYTELIAQEGEATERQGTALYCNNH